MDRRCRVQGDGEPAAARDPLAEPPERGGDRPPPAGVWRDSGPLQRASGCAERGRCPQKGPPHPAFPASLGTSRPHKETRPATYFYRDVKTCSCLLTAHNSMSLGVSACARDWGLPLLGVCGGDLHRSLEQTSAPACSLRHDSQLPRRENGQRPRTDGRTDKEDKTHAVEYYSALKRRSWRPRQRGRTSWALCRAG